ncbi:MAG: bifunctional protein-disulfide isomerase/oxidoreductase DsbC [Gammaproteobacteria bacterium]|nr:bifunctional protein-disulfide isomerase/oxidoreductase DsbC [Gammaproteobacteria bacterium]
MKLTRLLCLLILLLTHASLQAADAPENTLRQGLQQLLPGKAPDSITESPLSGVYEVHYGSDIFYVSRDGRYLLQGDLYDLVQKANLTEAKRAVARKVALATVSDADKIIFKGTKTDHIIDVFTDVDCGYCRKLHQQIADYNELGIEIRYLAFPRTGINTESYYKAVSVWCSKDKQTALTRAKQGVKMPRLSCNNTVAEQFALGNQIGVDGTPTLVLADGTVIPGYKPPQELRQLLDEHFAPDRH